MGSGHQEMASFSTGKVKGRPLYFFKALRGCLINSAFSDLRSFRSSYWIDVLSGPQVPAWCPVVYRSLGCFFKWSVSLCLFRLAMDHSLLPCPSVLWGRGYTYLNKLVLVLIVGGKHLGLLIFSTYLRKFYDLITCAGGDGERGFQHSHQDRFVQ